MARGDRRKRNQGKSYRTDENVGIKIKQNWKVGTGEERRRERTRTKIYTGTHPYHSISVYGKTTDTGFMKMVVDT